MSELTTITNGILTLTVSSYGAEMHSVIKDGKEYLWQGNPEFWPDRAINLFPFTGSLFESRFISEGESYTIPFHGFAYRSDFRLHSQTSDTLEYILTDSAATLTQYPFRFALIIGYKLSANTIQVSYTVRNNDDKTMYFALGGHPGFLVPLDKGSLEDYRIEFASDTRLSLVSFVKDGLIGGSDTPYPLSNNAIPLTHEMFCTVPQFFRNSGGCASLRSNVTNRSVTVRYPDMPILGLWKAKSPEAGYVCIEPWSALPGRYGVIEDIGTKPDMTALASSETHLVTWYMDIN